MINLISSFIRKRNGSSGVEAALLLPVLMTMLFGVFDLGHAITANHKMITATQVIADLVTRNPTVSDSDITQSIEAGVLSMNPYATSENDFGIDIASVQFDSNGDPQVLWRTTQNMSPDDTAVADTKGLGAAGEGAVVVTMIYDYKPTFGGSVIPAYRMRERAFARGRRSSIVTKQ